VYVNLAAVRIRQRNFESALQLLDRAKEINPRQVQVAFTRGIVYSNMDRQDLAIQEYLKELDLDPNFVAADVELGKSYERLGDRDKATSYYQKVIAAEPSNAEALQGLARIVASKFSK
jgi:tetratricopeptide (TPR) repeat protein